MQILVQRRNYDADGRPIEGALRRFPVTVTPLKKARWDLGLEFDEVWAREGAKPPDAETGEAAEGARPAVGASSAA